MSGIQIADFKKPDTIRVRQAQVESSYGPKSSILLSSSATSYSKAGFSFSIKGLSRDSLLNGLFVTIPLQVKWVAGAAGATVLLPNGYAELDGLEKADMVQAGKFNQYKDMSKTHDVGLYAYDNIAIRPNAFKCIRDATLSINGSSFSIRNDSIYTAMCKLFADGRKEEISGCDYECAPYNFCGSAGGPRQRGWFERCKALNTRGKLKYIARDGNNCISALVYQYDVRFPIWFGPFIHKGFPGLEGFDGNSVKSIPYVSDLVLECNFTDDVIMDAFACPDDTVQNKYSVHCPPWNDLAAAHAGDFMPNTKVMWENLDIGREAAQFGADATKFVNLLEPTLSYMWSEPNPKFTRIEEIYTLPSYRFITYEDRQSFAGGAQASPTVQISFPQIRLANISSLYVAFCEPDRVDQGGVSAPRTARWSGDPATNGGWDPTRLGIACANRTMKIKWDTVKCSMSVNSSVLANFTPESMTRQRQYELFMKYSGGAQADMSIEEYERHSSMILFSAEELCGIGALGNSFQSMTMSLSFQCYKPSEYSGVTTQDLLTAQAGDVSVLTKMGQDRACAVVGRLVCLEPELVSISEGAVTVSQVKLGQSELESQLLSGSAPEREDGISLDQKAR